MRGCQPRNVPSVQMADSTMSSHVEAPDWATIPVPSDEHLTLARALRLPTLETSGMTLLKRLTLVIRDGVIEHVFYPVFPPDRNAGDVVAWLSACDR